MAGARVAVRGHVDVRGVDPQGFVADLRRRRRDVAVERRRRSGARGGVAGGLGDAGEQGRYARYDSGGREQSQPGRAPRRAQERRGIIRRRGRQVGGVVQTEITVQRHFEFCFRTFT